MSDHLVIGGPKHGELVDWDIELRYYQIPVFIYNPITGEHTQTRIYRVKQLMLFDRPCHIWLYDIYRFGNPESEAKWTKLLMKEILSYKGGVMFYSAVQDE